MPLFRGEFFFADQSHYRICSGWCVSHMKTLAKSRSCDPVHQIEIQFIMAGEVKFYYVNTGYRDDIDGCPRRAH